MSYTEATPFFKMSHDMLTCLLSIQPVWLTIILNLSAKECYQYLVWDVDAEEDTEDTITSSFFEQIDKDDRKRKTSSKKKQKGSSGKSKKKRAKSSDDSASDENDESDDDDDSDSSSDTWTISMIFFAYHSKLGWPAFIGPKSIRVSTPCVHVNKTMRL